MVAEGEIMKNKDLKQCIVCFYPTENAGLKSDIEQLQAENKRLKEFARQVIMDVCWDMHEPDGGDMQDIAEKLGLIKPTIATEDDIDDESDFEVGDTIFKFADILKGND
jgi:hypothetical protein